MVTRPSFGKTWWGEQWLAALTHIDYDNRLPRGRSYANKGAVSELTVKAGTIQAKVQAHAPVPTRSPSRCRRSRPKIRRGSWSGLPPIRP